MYILRFPSLIAQLVIQTEYGVSRAWYWPLIAPFQRFRWKRQVIGPQKPPNDLETAQLDGKDPVAETTQSNVTNTSVPGDNDVTSERDRITSGDATNSPLIISMARKDFGKRLAVRDVSIAVGAGEILALLGPNGAGKTTLVNCVLGLYRFTSGTAKIEGFDITRQHDQVYQHVGICPQREILWPDLTCDEHLLFYARLKGIDAWDEKAVVRQCLEQVELAEEAKKLSKALSGGQKRRLAIAIALVARPAVVFLDEPTTGLDPNVKRSLWRVIKTVKDLHGMCIVLTTHSMFEPIILTSNNRPEADFLADRIGIMVQGSLRCIGSGTHLKQTYGKGYKLTLTCPFNDLSRQRINTYPIPQPFVAFTVD